VEKILISACLLGERVRHHGGDARLEHPMLVQWAAEGRLVPFCPEVAGGLATPRPAAELVSNASGRRPRTAEGQDVTAAFERGADAALQVCTANGVRIAVLKDGSPSCGSRWVYDGSFSGRRVAGTGVSAARLREAGIEVFSEQQIGDAAAYLARLEASG
jgi:uncharacterized protein YbbK (DUF523 family)